MSSRAHKPQCSGFQAVAGDGPFLHYPAFCWSLASRPIRPVMFPNQILQRSHEGQTIFGWVYYRNS